MWTKNMSAAAKARPMLQTLVQRAEEQAGSRMIAYDIVARSVGTTGGWVRKFLGRQFDKLDADIYESVIEKYQHLCLAIENKTADKQVIYTQLLESDKYAADQSNTVMASHLGEAMGSDAQ